MRPEYVQSRKENFKLKHEIKENNCTIKSSTHKTRKEKYCNRDGDTFLLKEII